jgi:hypothetical protein
MKIDFKELEKEKKFNLKEKLKFIRYWVEYIKSHKGSEWSQQQNIIINSQIN